MQKYLPFLATQTQSLISVSVKAIPSLTYSITADCLMCFIITGSLASDAIKAALKAMLRILPTAIFNRDNLV